MTPSLWCFTYLSGTGPIEGFTGNFHQLGNGILHYGTPHNGHMYHAHCVPLAKAGATSKSLRFIRNLCYHVIEILVESSALYVVVLAIFIVFDAMNSPYNMYPQAVLDSVTVSLILFC